MSIKRTSPSSAYIERKDGETLITYAEAAQYRFTAGRIYVVGGDEFAGYELEIDERKRPVTMSGVTSMIVEGDESAIRHPNPFVPVHLWFDVK